MTGKPEIIRHLTRGRCAKIRIRTSGGRFSYLQRRELQIRMVAGFADVVERADTLVAEARFELTTFRLSVRRGILWRPALILLPEPHQVGLTSRVPLFDLFLYS